MVSTRHLESLRGPYQPSPAGPEDSAGCFSEVFTEFLITSKVFVDKFCETTRRMTTAIRLHGLPIEVVVEGLTSIIEQGLILAKSFSNNRNNIFILEIGAFDQIVGHCHVTSMMLSVVNSQGFLPEVRLEGIVSIRKIIQLNSLE